MEYFELSSGGGRRFGVGVDVDVVVMSGVCFSRTPSSFLHRVGFHSDDSQSNALYISRRGFAFAFALGRKRAETARGGLRSFQPQ